MSLISYRMHCRPQSDAASLHQHLAAQPWDSKVCTVCGPLYALISSFNMPVMIIAHWMPVRHGCSGEVTVGVLY